MKRMITIGLVLGACGGGGMPGNGADGNPGSDGSVHHPDGSGSDIDASVDGHTSDANATIFTIVIENHDYAEIVGSSNAPYINSLIAQYGLATNYKDTDHPSLPNYLHMISGDDAVPGLHRRRPDAGPVLPGRRSRTSAPSSRPPNITWRSYQESMGTRVQADRGRHVRAEARPVPLLHRHAERATALRGHATSTTASFAADLASNTYRYMWITPNLTDDGHDPSTDPVNALKTSDTWLVDRGPEDPRERRLQERRRPLHHVGRGRGPQRRRPGPDPDDRGVAEASSRPGMTSTTAFTHASYLATIDDILGLPRLDNGQDRAEPDRVPAVSVRASTRAASASSASL